MAQFHNSAESYGIVARAFHWLVAGLVLAQLPLGLYAASLPVSFARLQWLSRHKSLGITILVLVLARLAWRALNPPPPLPSTMPAWERNAARLNHWIIYGLLVAAPLAGWLYASAAGLGVNWFGLLHLPDLVAKDRALAGFFKTAHFGLVALLSALVALHVGAALHHAFVRRDGIMQRMWPRKGQPRTP